MTIHEYGIEHAKHLLFFQGSCEPWEEFAEAVRLLGQGFHIMLVTPDGHDPKEHLLDVKDQDRRALHDGALPSRAKRNGGSGQSVSESQRKEMILYKKR